MLARRAAAGDAEGRQKGEEAPLTAAPVRSCSSDEEGSVADGSGGEEGAHHAADAPGVCVRELACQRALACVLQGSSSAHVAR